MSIDSPAAPIGVTSSDPSQGSPPAPGEWAGNWPIVLAAAAGTALSTLHVYSTGVFLSPLEQEFGWSRAGITAGLTITSVVGVVTSPFIGLMIDRVGPRRIGVYGSAIFCLTVAMLALATSSIWSWFALWTLIAISSTAVKPTVWTAAVSSVFKNGRGLALSVTLCSTGLGSSLTPIISNYLILTYGWRIAYLGLAGFWAVLVLPLLYFFFTSALDRERRKPTDPNTRTAVILSGVTVREGFRSPRFYKLAAAAFLISSVAVSFTVSFVPVLVSTGFTKTQAAELAGLIGIASIIGRLVGGYLLDRVGNGNFVGAVSVLLPIVSCVALLAWPGHYPVAILAALALGLSLGAELDAVAYLATRHLGMRSFGTLFGTIAGLLSLSVGVGPLAVSYSYDVTHAYTLAMIVFIPLCVITAALFMWLGPYPEFEEA